MTKVPYFCTCRNIHCEHFMVIDLPEKNTGVQCPACIDAGRHPYAGGYYWMQCRRLRVKHSDHECDARCHAAKEPMCICSCGGRNHGSAYRMALTRSK